nr:PREDICTED: probable rhodanese domain-containing dual specificity protein phosphatase [Latimeria chalumnae]|eukprot:XP_006006523.2 PREDICTED: probable rhodanese domain-containing dual specificity protein phosphatase [Latimeria chalumnae]
MDPVILAGGYATFAQRYPFLCTPKMILLVNECKAITIYPSEILENALYQGTAEQATNYKVIKNLHITHILNVAAEIPSAFPAIIRYLNFKVMDDMNEHIEDILPTATEFIAEALQADCRVLVHCNTGKSRSSAITLAYLMEYRHWILKDAYEWLKKQRTCATPNMGFLKQLSVYEEKLFGKKLTDVEHIGL